MRRWRGPLVAALLLIGFAVALGALLGSARGNLEDGALRLEAARAFLTEQDVAAAEQEFTAAVDAFSRGSRSLRNPVVRLARVVPVAGANLRAALTVADAGRSVALAGQIFTGELIRTPGGISALAPSGGGIPLEPVTALAPAAAEAADLVEDAAQRLRAGESPWLIGTVASAHAQLTSELARLTPTVTGAAALSEQLPAFLGARQTRRYFFGAGNPAELRGATGFIGAYAILTADGGNLSFGRFAPIHDLPDVDVEDIEPPSPDYAARYDRYGGAGFWKNINMTPDFPTAATAMENLYERVTGDGVDGVIVATPEALATLLRVTGPTRLRGVGEINADNVVELVANEAYGQFDDEDTRKRLLGAVAARVFEQLLSGDADPVLAARALAAAAGSGNIRLHSTHADEQAALEAAGLAGALPNPAGDFFTVTGNNAAANKVDFYTSRRLTYDAVLLPEGNVATTATVRLTNEAPTSGVPTHVIGPNRGDLKAGENSTLLSTYCATDCLLRDARRDGEEALVTPEYELEHPVFSSLVHLPSGESTQLAYDWTLDRGWSGGDTGGSYTLIFHNQPTIRPTALDLTVTIPDGMEIVRTSHPMTRADERLSWSGTPAAVERFEIVWRRPPGQLFRDRIRGIWNRPLFR